MLSFEDKLTHFSLLMSNIERERGNARIGAIIAMFKYLRDFEELWQRYPRFKLKLIEKMNDLLDSQIGVEVEMMLRGKEDAEREEKLDELAGVIEQLQDVIDVEPLRAPTPPVEPLRAPTPL